MVATGVLSQTWGGVLLVYVKDVPFLSSHGTSQWCTLTCVCVCVDVCCVGSYVHIYILVVSFSLCVCVCVEFGAWGVLLEDLSAVVVLDQCVHRSAQTSHSHFVPNVPLPLCKQFTSCTFACVRNPNLCACNSNKPLIR